MFLSKATMRKKAEAVAGRVDTANAPSDKGTGRHPLLREAKINAVTKTAYLNGCVLASVLRTGKASRKAHGAVRRIGYSLQMTADEIRESFAVVGGLSGEREESRFIDEVLDKLKKRPVRRYFMLDIERILKADGNISGEIAEMVNYIGTVLFGGADWRGKMVLDGRRTKKKGKGKKVFRRARRNVGSARDDDNEDKSICPERRILVAEEEDSLQIYERLAFGEQVARRNAERRKQEKQNRIKTELTRIKRRYRNIKDRTWEIRDFLMREGLSDSEIKEYIDREEDAFLKEHPFIGHSLLQSYYDAEPYLPDNQVYRFGDDDF